MLKTDNDRLTRILKYGVAAGAVTQVVGYNPEDKIVVEIQGKTESSSVTDKEISLMLGGTKVLIGVSGNNTMFVNITDVTKVKISNKTDSIVVENSK